MKGPVALFCSCGHALSCQTTVCLLTASRACRSHAVSPLSSGAGPKTVACCALRCRKQRQNLATQAAGTRDAKTRRSHASSWVKLPRGATLREDIYLHTAGHCWQFSICRCKVLDSTLARSDLSWSHSWACRKAQEKLLPPMSGLNLVCT